MADDKVRVKQISWADIVNKLDPKRNEKKVTYEFSNGRKFKGNVKYT